MPNTPNLGLPLMAAAQAQKHVTHNEALVGLDTLVQLGVLSKGLTAPPAAAGEGDRYLVAAANPTGAWSGWSGRIARFQDGQWVSYPPKPGWFAFVVDENDLYTYTGSAWTSFRAVVYALTSLQNLSLLGMGTTADAANPFAAKLNKALWTAKPAAEGGTGDLRYTLNKEAPANTLSLLLQSAFSGRAEIGLTGDDDLHLKVSADGAAWTEAVRIDRATGGLGFLAAGTSLASAAVTDLGSVASLKVDITGTAPIGSFGTRANSLKLVRFTGALTLTHNAASLVLPGAANITTAAGDTAIVTSDGIGNWRVRHYQRADGTSVNPDAPAVAATLAAAPVTDLGSIRTLKVDITGTTAITSFGTGPNLLRYLRFAGALTLTHHATSLSLPGGANIATAAGDTAIALSDGSGNWRIHGYARASGKAVVPPVQADVAGLTATDSPTFNALTATGGLTVTGGFLTNSYNSSANPPAAGGPGIAIGWNRTQADGEVDFLNRYNGGFRFLTKATSGYSDLAYLTLAAFRPGPDNALSLGTATLRWSTLYAGSGAINTSDARGKALRGGLSGDELAAWADVRPQVFQFLDAVGAKGEEGARLHAGYTAQAVRDAFRARGLDPGRYALWCADSEIRTVSRTRIVQRPRTEVVEIEVPVIAMEEGRAVRRLERRRETRPLSERLPVHDDAGVPIPDLFHEAPVMESVEETYDHTEPTGEMRLGLRYDQCLVLEAAYLRSEIGALRDEIAALKARPRT